MRASRLSSALWESGCGVVISCFGTVYNIVLQRGDSVQEPEFRYLDHRLSETFPTSQHSFPYAR